MSQLEEKTADANQGGMAQAVTGAAGHVAEVASDRGKDLAGGALEEIRKVGSEAALQAQHVLEDARSTALGRAHSEVAGVASSLRGLADQGQALVEGRPDEAGTVVKYVERGVERVRQVADSLDSRGPAGLAGDLQALARRRPGAFLAVAGVGGFVIGRMVRSGVLNNPASQPEATSSQRSVMGEPQIFAPEADEFLSFPPVATQTPDSELESPWLDLDRETPGAER